MICDQTQHTETCHASLNKREIAESLIIDPARKHCIGCPILAAFFAARVGKFVPFQKGRINKQLIGTDMSSSRTQSAGGSCCGNERFRNSRATNIYYDRMANPTPIALAAVVCLFLTGAVEAQVHTVAMTVDDLPFASGVPLTHSTAEARKAERVNKAILDAFSHHHIPATGFVIEQRAEEIGLPVSRKILERWTRPGFDLGNHLYSHPDVNTLSVGQIEREITDGESTFGPLLKEKGRTPQFLRFPYNHTGDTKEKHDAIAAFMAEYGYRLAPCTIDNTDYEFNVTYTLALKRKDEEAAAKVRAAYIAYTAAEIDWYTALDKQVFGYDPPHVMLLHDSPLNADTIEEVLTLFEERGYRFVSLGEALKDPAYAVPETFITKFGPMWGYRWAREKQVRVDGRNEPDPPAWVSQYVKDHQAKQ